MSADPQTLLADYKAGKLVNPLGFLIAGLQAAHVDLARTAHRRKAVVAEELAISPEGLARAAKSLEAADKRKRKVTDEQRLEDTRVVAAALYRLAQEHGMRRGYEIYGRRLVALLSAALDLPKSRVREALKSAPRVQTEHAAPIGRGTFFDELCAGCWEALEAYPVRDVCLMHGSPEALFKAGAPTAPLGAPRFEWGCQPETPYGYARSDAAYAARKASGDEPDERKTYENARKYSHSLAFKARPRMDRTAQGFAPKWTSAGKVGFGPLKLHTT